MRLIILIAAFVLGVIVCVAIGVAAQMTFGVPAWTVSTPLGFLNGIAVSMLSDRLPAKF